jgi:hypothetical protein
MNTAVFTLLGGQKLIWSEADCKPTPFYLEADTFLWGLAKSRSYALSSPCSLYASSDHLPLKWVRKCDKGPVSALTLEQLSDMAWIHSYIPGPENTLYIRRSQPLPPSRSPRSRPDWDRPSCLNLARPSARPLPRRSQGSASSHLPTLNAFPNKSKPGAAPRTPLTPTPLPTALLRPLIFLSLSRSHPPKTPHALPPACYPPLSPLLSFYLRS